MLLTLFDNAVNLVLLWRKIRVMTKKKSDIKSLYRYFIYTGSLLYCKPFNYRSFFRLDSAQVNSV